MHSNFDFAVAVSNTNDVAVTVTVTRGSTSVVQETVAAASVKVITLPWVPSLKGPDGQGATVALVPMPSSVLEPGGAYKLVSTRPVTVYQYNALQYQSGNEYSYTNDASLLLPVNTWRTKYMVAARHHFLATSGYYTVVASEDATQVTVAKGVKPLSMKGGVPGVDSSGNGTFTLNAGDVATLVTEGSQQNDPSDVTGSLVTSDKPVQVFGGHQCTYVPYNSAACDHLEEAMFPVDTLSREYIVTAPMAPDGGGPKSNLVRIIATDSDTTLTYDPPQPGAPESIAQSGDWAEFQTTGSFQIKGNKRFLLAQYALGQDAGGGGGDPDLSIGIPTAQYRTDYLFHAPVSYAQNFVNITAPLAATVTLDGSVVSGLEPIGTTPFGAVRVALPTINDGNHTITGDQPFGITVYGYGQYTSYWYPGGLDLDEIKE
ncbi:MAG: hypothetical protein EOO74_06235 [Myxococcales bacterium]|nr:MAG: hypothetical protein EOO74_06235 [Myxococcales bacterium]